MSAKGRAKEKATILVADDESGIRDVFVEMITDLGYRVVAASDSAQATALVKSEPIKMAFIDNWMPPGIDGIEAIKHWKDEGYLTFPAVVVTGFAKIESAAEAMRNGAYDVLSKPIKREQVEKLLNKVKVEAKTELFDPAIRDLEMGKSPALMRLKGELLKAASGKGPVTMVGQPNDGCEFLAMLLHSLGKPWVVLNDQRAMEANPNVRLNEARNGTIYIKNVDHMSLTQQRGLELLARNASISEVRIVCEVRQPVDDLVKEGAMEKDLGEFLAPHQVFVPSIAEIENDLHSILGLIVRRLSLAEGMGDKRFSDDALALMVADKSRWSMAGLDGLIAVARVLLRGAANGSVECEQVSSLLNTGEAPSGVGFDESIFAVPLRESRQEFEKMYFKKLLERANNNYVEAARHAGIERTYLYRKIRSVLGADVAKEF